MCAKLLQSCLTLCDPTDCSLPAPLSMGFSRQEYWSELPCPLPRDLPDPRTRVSYVSCVGSRFFTTSTTWEAPQIVYLLANKLSNTELLNSEENWISDYIQPWHSWGPQLPWRTNSLASKRTRKLNTLARDIRYCQGHQHTCQTSGTTGREGGKVVFLLGRWSLLPASILTSKKKTSILQTQLMITL